mgnify:CR=1 FL=1
MPVNYETRAKTGPKAPTDPIRSAWEIKRIKEALEDSPRDYALFMVGINTAFRASDLLALNVGDVRYLNAGETITVKEKKTARTGKRRTVTFNTQAIEALQPLLALLKDAPDDAPLFTNRYGERMTVLWLGRLVKKWCEDARCKPGNYSSHTLRKTFGYVLRTRHRVPVELLQQAYGHSSGAITLKYVAIQPEELQAMYMLGVE